MFESSWNDTSLFLDSFASLHGMCLTSTSLSISKYCTIISLKNTFYNGKGSLLEDILLKTNMIKDHIEAEIPLLLSGLFCISYNDFSPIWDNIHNGLVTKCDLSR